jgi:hypothetical protein
LPDAALAIPLSFTRISSSRRIRYSWSSILMSLPVYLPNKIQIAHLYVERDTMALFHLARSDGHYFPLLRLFLSRIGDDDPAPRGFFFFQPACQNAVM